MPESAEMIAGIAGTRRVKEKTEQMERFLFMDQTTGMKPVREVEEFESKIEAELQNEKPGSRPKLKL